MYALKRFGDFGGCERFSPLKYRAILIPLTGYDSANCIPPGCWAFRVSSSSDPTHFTIIDEIVNGSVVRCHRAYCCYADAWKKYPAVIFTFFCSSGTLHWARAAEQPDHLFGAMLDEIPRHGTPAE